MTGDKSVRKKDLISHAAILFRERGKIHLIRSTLGYIYRNVIEKSNIQFLFESTDNLGNKNENFNVLFITAYKGDSMRYRAINQSEELNINGVKCDIKDMWGINLLKFVNYYEVFIFQRVLHSKAVEKMIYKISESKKVSIYDVDDLVFDFELASRLRLTDKAIFLNNVKKYKKVLEKCDYALTTTEFIAKILRERFGINTFVNRNCLSLEQIKISEEAIKYKSQLKLKDDGRVRLGYFSGSHTHDYDFLKVTDALIYIMNKYEYVDLYVGGLLDLNPKFNQFKDRIRRIPLVHWKKLPFEMTKVDINLAPLEINNPFSHGKSELKYFEAGILGIPTIATPIDAFKFAIKHGENGLLASNSEEWLKGLEHLICDEKMRRQIGENARQHVKAYYNPYYRGRQFIDILKQISDKNI